MNENIVRKGYVIVSKDKKITKPIQSLVDKVLLKTSFKKENGLYGNIEILNFDLDRVYLEANGIEFTIRMWNIIDLPKKFKVIWTFFKDVPCEYGSYGKEVGYGMSLVDRPKQ